MLQRRKLGESRKKTMRDSFKKRGEGRRVVGALGGVIARPKKRAGF